MNYAGNENFPNQIFQIFEKDIKRKIFTLLAKLIAFYRNKKQFTLVKLKKIVLF